MLNELNQAIISYQAKWQALIGTRRDREFFQSLRPTAVGWKTVDLADFDKRFAELRPRCDQIHLGWVNDRWLATMHLKDAPLEWGISVIKLMQRRPGSSDAPGLDHLDFLLHPEIEAKAVLASEPDIKWSEEANGAQCQWLSIWFVGTEAKLRLDSVLDACISELQTVNSKIQQT